MKFVFLNRDLLNASVVSDLRRAGHGVFVCGEMREAELVLKIHGKTISLVMGHDQPGAELLATMKASQRFMNVPFLLTHSSWSAQEIEKHKKGVSVAHAYQPYPCSETELLKAIDSILGTQLASQGKSAATDLSQLSPLATPLSASPFEGVKDSMKDGISLMMDVPALQEAANAGYSVEEATRVHQGGGQAAGDYSIDIPMSVLPSEPATDADQLLNSLPSPLDLQPSNPTAVTEVLATDIIPDLGGGTQMSIKTESTTESPSRSLEPSTEIDTESLSQMPYLQSGATKLSPLAYTPPLDDALVPGGAANAPDVETLKRYLLLREQDVLALSAQLKQAKDQIANLDQQLRHERATNTEFAHLVQEQGRRIDSFDQEKIIAAESAQSEIDDLKFELKRRTDKAKLLEFQIREATQETEKLKERVRIDIRKIRSREKELENRLEIMKKDSEALLNGREQKIVELKRKLDLAEFNMDLLQDQYEKEKTHAAQLRAKLERAAQVVRVAGGLLHPSDFG